MNKALFDIYLDILDISVHSLDLDQLEKLLRSHLVKIPFENISKLFLWQQTGKSQIPDLETYLKNIRELDCGGTCYTINYYFYLLLRYLGYEATLHGTDMPEGANVHIVIKVQLKDKQYLVDMGYGAPFYNPLPLFLDKPLSIKWGDVVYELSSQNEKQQPQVAIYQNEKMLHYYSVNPEPRNIDYFSQIIADSYNQNMTFMNILRIIRYFNDYSQSIKNFGYHYIDAQRVDKQTSGNLAELETIVQTQLQLAKIPVRAVGRMLGFGI